MFDFDSIFISTLSDNFFLSCLLSSIDPLLLAENKLNIFARTWNVMQNWTN